MSTTPFTPPISTPRPPEPLDPPAFPLFASIAPVVASMAIWAFTQSPFALVFALLGPVVALAGLADSRRQSRRRSRDERARFDREIESTGRAIATAHEAERAKLHAATPSALDILAAAPHDPERWRAQLGGEVLVTLGNGSTTSSVCLDGAPPSGATGMPELAIRELYSKATTLQDAPIVVDARLGIGLCGPESKVVPAAGAILAQLAHALPPDDVGLRAEVPPVRGLQWIASLPHWHGARGDESVSTAQIDFRSRVDSDTHVFVACASSESELPADCRIVVLLGGASTAKMIRHPQGHRDEFVPGFVTAREGHILADTLAAAANRRSPRDAAATTIPTSVDFASLQPAVIQGSALRGRSSLTAFVGAGRNGPAALDLVADGPHAVVGGTTGSGKSELLLTWVLSLAASHSPDMVNFLLVDFKGGSAFAPLQGLPHVVGIVTDLDEVGARRALESLKAELRYREAVLAGARARSIQELPAHHDLARLVIVVDEFATLTAGFSDLHEIFADLAARGRSLGVHLILCTQRPAGSVRDNVLANCALRISLRVNNRADSVAVIGEPDAAELPRHPPGRAIIATGERVVCAQVAIAAETVTSDIIDRWAPAPNVRRPWLEPLPKAVLPDMLLPDMLPLDGVPRGQPGAMAFGLVDRPDKQSRQVAVYDPAEHGHLLVVGGRRAGKTGALAAFAAASPTSRWVPSSVEGSWDMITGTLEGVRDGSSPPGLLLFDDVDTVLGKFPADHRAAFVDALSALHREGPARDVHIVSASASPIAPLAELCEAKLVLRLPHRHDHVAAAGSIDGFDPAVAAGGGTWRKFRVQVVHTPFTDPHDEPTVAKVPCIRSTGLAVVSSSPRSLEDKLGRLGPVTMIGTADSHPGVELDTGGRIVLGDPDAWNAAWGMLGALRGRTPILFHSVSVSEFRALSGRRTLPPPITSLSDTGWLLHPDGRVQRVRLPG